MESKTFVKNQYGINIAKCCASCAYKTLRNQYRYCGFGSGAARITDTASVCDRWIMNPVYENVGRGGTGGKVKSKDYLSFAIDTITETVNMSAVELRRRYKEQGGKKIYAIDD